MARVAPWLYPPQVLRRHQPAAGDQRPGHERLPGGAGAAPLHRLQHAERPQRDLLLRQQVQWGGEWCSPCVCVCVCVGVCVLHQAGHTRISVLFKCYCQSVLEVIREESFWVNRRQDWDCRVSVLFKSVCTGGTRGFHPLDVRETKTFTSILSNYRLYIFYWNHPKKERKTERNIFIALFHLHNTSAGFNTFYIAVSCF